MIAITPKSAISDGNFRLPIFLFFEVFHRHVSDETHELMNKQHARMSDGALGTIASQVRRFDAIDTSIASGGMLPPLFNVNNHARRQSDECFRLIRRARHP